MKFLRRTLVTLLSGAAVLTAAPPAGAATNPYTPTEVCGAGYRVISSLPAKTDDGRKWGGVYLLYKSGGYNCVVTIKWSFIGVATDTFAGLYRDSEDSSRNVYDQGNYKYYAVVRGYAPQCISYAGWVSDRPGEGGTGAVAVSGWGWCG
ncbi:hypothetical protein [Amycolatopsis sp. DG1A-15b]|uniref:hypothetical protein n=1 Tax=Amycolatopsis sp. DG1A-15b TaxID=3052846 RepID=UPI00255C17E1|nr:hypothetical protein [Amycolatopsis sp. DG1A-15b]WIX91484.1 hypothetical protein QRY02_14045 [Amycolatopsis sp. DG1A-15b]